MIISIPKETNLNETRVAATPQSVKDLIKAGYKVKIQTGAGNKSFISDAAYKEVGANIIEVEASLYRDADIIIKVAPPTPEEISLLSKNSILISFFQPTIELKSVKAMTDSRIKPIFKIVNEGLILLDYAISINVKAISIRVFQCIRTIQWIYSNS